MYDHLGPRLSKSLPAYHALTGCDYTAPFCRKGKVAPLKLLERDDAIQNTFRELGYQEISESSLEIIELFVYKMYGMKNLTSINEVFFLIFIDFLFMCCTLLGSIS